MTDTPKPGTPLPWKRESNYITGLVVGGRPSGEVIARCYRSVSQLANIIESEEDAAYIVYACNTLPELEAQLAELGKPCVWKRVTDNCFGGYTYTPACREGHYVEKGPRYEFCPYCGHKLVIAITEESEA